MVEQGLAASGSASGIEPWGVSACHRSPPFQCLSWSKASSLSVCCLRGFVMATFSASWEQCQTSVSITGCISISGDSTVHKGLKKGINEPSLEITFLSDSALIVRLKAKWCIFYIGLLVMFTALAKSTVNSTTGPWGQVSWTESCIFWQCHLIQFFRGLKQT